MKYQNKNAVNVRNSFEMIISCGPCKKDLMRYQKQGVGNLLRIHLPRILESEVDINTIDSLICPKCNKHLGDVIDIDNHKAIRVRRGYVHTRRSDK